MNRDDHAALVRSAIAVAAGAALLAAIGLAAGRWAAGAVAITCIGAAAWLPTWRRPGWRRPS